MMNRIALLSVAVLVLSGCATMSKDECLMADWQTVGYEDGSRGAPASAIAQHRKACADHGVAPDLQAYRHGRADGLRQFCRAQNGFNLGSRGGHYNGVCPKDSEPEFLEAYNRGRTLHELQSNVNHTARQIAAYEHELDDLQQAKEDGAIDLVTGEMTSDERLALLLSLKDMEKREDEIERELRELNRLLGVHESELAEYRASLAYNF